MNDIAINKRIIFQNLALHFDKSYLLLNLYSFRRVLLSSTDYQQLERSLKKVLLGYNLTANDDSVYWRLREEKQILDSEIIQQLDREIEATLNNTLGQVRTILINLSYNCNLNCGYCYQKRYKSKQGRICSNDIIKIKKFVENYNSHKNKLQKVVISGGEPLLEENIDTINTALNEFDDCEFELFTNGTNILRFSDKVNFEKFREVQLSLDGNDAVIQKISGMPQMQIYKTIIEGIKYLKSKGCKITIACVMTPGIHQWLQAFLEGLINSHIFDKNVNLRIGIPIINSSDEIVDKRFFSYDEYVSVKKILKKNYGIEVSLDSLPSFSRIRAKIYREINTRPKQDARLCKVDAKTPLAFGPNGNVYWCLCEDPTAAILGNYGTGEINSELLYELKTRNIFTIPECRNCDMRYLCASGCPTPLFAAGKNILSPACRELNNDYLVDRMETFVL